LSELRQLRWRAAVETITGTFHDLLELNVCVLPKPVLPRSWAEVGPNARNEGARPRDEVFAEHGRSARLSARCLTTSGRELRAALAELCLKPADATAREYSMRSAHDNSGLTMRHFRSVPSGTTREAIGSRKNDAACRRDKVFAEDDAQELIE
jgi:hypothetical protein